MRVLNIISILIILNWQDFTTVREKKQNKKRNNHFPQIIFSGCVMKLILINFD